METEKTDVEPLAPAVCSSLPFPFEESINPEFNLESATETLREYRRTKFRSAVASHDDNPDNLPGKIVRVGRYPHTYGICRSVRDGKAIIDPYPHHSYVWPSFGDKPTMLDVRELLGRQA